MAWIVKLPPSPHHRRIRWQVRYQDGPHERSAGIYQTKPEALTRQARHRTRRAATNRTGARPRHHPVRRLRHPVWSELVALRWEDFRPDLPLDDGAIAGPGRIKLRRPAMSPPEQEPEYDEEAEHRRPVIHRNIALDQQDIDALLTYREHLTAE